MIKDVDKLNDNDQLVMDLTVKEAMLIAAFPLALYHLKNPSTVEDDLQQRGANYVHTKMHALNSVATSITDGTMENLMDKIGHAMEVAVYLRRQK